MKLNFSRDDLKDLSMGMLAFSVVVTILYCAILLLPNQFGMRHEWQDSLLDITKEHWPIFLGGMIVISFFYSIVELAKRKK